MPDEPGVAPGSPLAQTPPGTPPKGARAPPGSDSERDSGFSDSGSEHLGRCEGTDTEEPPGLGHAHLSPQPPGAAARPLLLLLRAPPAAVAGPEGTGPCPRPVPPAVPAELPPCPRPVPPAAPAELSPCPRPVPPAVPAELSPCPRRGAPGAALLAALALRTGALLRHNRRTQGDIATLRRHTRLLARASRDPRAWPRLCHLLRPPGSHRREPPGQ